MKTFKLKATSQFKKMAGKLSPEVANQLNTALKQLQKDPTYPSLCSKKYKTKKGILESSINLSYRILWEYDMLDNNSIILLAVGKHDIL